MRYARKALTPTAQDETVWHVVEHISSCCSETDDPAEFAGEVIVKFVPVQGEPEAVMVVGELHGHSPTAYYFGEEVTEPERNKPAKVREPVDLTPAQLQDHLERKAAQ